MDNWPAIGDTGRGPVRFESSRTGCWCAGRLTVAQEGFVRVPVNSPDNLITVGLRADDRAATA